MPSLSPKPPAVAVPSSPRNASGDVAGGALAASGAMRPPLMKRQSSQSSQSSVRHLSSNHVTSPASLGEHPPLRHHVKPRHTKIVLPRNHNSARNLTKLNRLAQADDGRKHARQRSHEGDTEIRLPGSLDEGSVRPAMRRNMTAYQLPRAGSHVKLKKNSSHGQLTRLGSARNLAALTATANRAPASPLLKGKSKRPKSAEMTSAEKELLEHAVARHPRQNTVSKPTVGDKKVGFAFGSSGDTSGNENLPQMEGSGLQEDEWTEESASASPYSTRQNTANNSRRASMNAEKASERQTPSQVLGMKLSEQVYRRTVAQKQKAVEAEPESGTESEDEPPSPQTLARVRRTETSPVAPPAQPSTSDDSRKTRQVQQPPLSPLASNPPTHQFLPRPSQRSQEGYRNAATTQQTTESSQTTTSWSPLHQAKDHQVEAQQSQVKEYANPATRRMLSKSQQVPGPAVISSVSALDDRHSQRGSPGPSIRSSKSNLGDGAGDAEQDELVSRFVPTASHSNAGSGANTATSTPKQSGFHTPEEGTSYLAQQRRGAGFQIGPTSPGSVRSGSSGATTPATGRSRTELRLLQEKALADMESRVDLKPHLPAWQYDRRNESLKSYMSVNTLGDGRGILGSGLGMGPEIFQGRFRAVNTELRVVQKFRDPIAESVARLRSCGRSKLNQRASPQKVNTPGLTTSKSAVALSATQKAKSLSKSASPPQQTDGLKRGTQSTVQFAGRVDRPKERREVSFASTPPETREYIPKQMPDATMVADALWNGKPMT